jgi:hypothetical protein
MSDELAGWPSQERGVDPIIGDPGSHQWLGSEASHHEDRPIQSPNANRVLPGTLPQVSGPGLGVPNHVNPLGSRSSASLEDN